MAYFGVVMDLSTYIYPPFISPLGNRENTRQLRYIQLSRGVYNFYLFCNRCNRVAEVHPHFHTFEFFHIHRLCLGASSKMLPKN